MKVTSEKIYYQVKLNLVSGGIIDDLIVSNAGDHLDVVSNAGCRHKDIPLMKDKEKEMKAAGKDVALEFVEDRGLVALQGPSMVSCLQPLVDCDLAKLGFMSRLGYIHPTIGQIFH